MRKSFLGRLCRKVASAAGRWPGATAGARKWRDLTPQFGRKLVVADIGCRWGSADIWDQLQPHVTLYGFDPDAAECERLRPLYKGRDVTLVPRALADTPGRRTLYLTREPACSSLYPPDPALITAVPWLGCATQTGTTEVETTTLDLWAAANDVGTVDFLKLDTQGSELDILRGGEGLLRTTRMLEIEVEFNPIYLGQPLFGDVDRFLRERGFELWSLSNMFHYSRGSQTDSSDGQLFWGHAHYVRADVAAAAGGDRHQAVRDAALAHVLGFGALAEALLQAGARSGPAELLKNA